MQLQLITIDKIMQSRAYTVIILSTGTRRFAIYTDPLVGKNLQNLLSNKPASRPLTHHLIDAVFSGFDVRIKQVVINNVEDTVYFARIFLEKQQGDNKEILEVDARPSDSLTLALMHEAPIYATKELLEKIVPIDPQ